MKLKNITLFILFIMITTISYAEESFAIKPIILNSENSESSTLGISYNLNGKLFDKKFDQEDIGDIINTNSPIGGIDISYSLEGVITEDYKNNPKNLLESKLSANYFRSSNFSMKAGAFIKTESDQRFENNQIVYGLTTTTVKRDVFRKNDSIAFHFNVGQVNPSEDKQREAILGSNLKTYNRIDLEFIYIYNIGTEHFDTFEINYRYFKELDAKSLIKDVKLDEFKFITYRIGFEHNLFIAYSSGELPFNKRSDQIYEIGFNYKFD